MKKLFFAMMITALTFNVLSAAEPKKEKTMEPTTEQRQKMAEAHEQMATCLRSDKPIAECHKELVGKCEETMGKGGCMMGMHMKGKMGHGGMKEKK